MFGFKSEVKAKDGNVEVTKFTDTHGYEQYYFRCKNYGGGINISFNSYQRCDLENTLRVELINDGRIVAIVDSKDAQVVIDAFNR